MKECLIFLTARYPYGSGEEFIENEINYINSFDDVFVISCLNKKQDELTRNVPDNIKVQNISQNITVLFNIKIFFCLLLQLKNKFVWSEILYIIKTKKKLPRRLIRFLYFMCQGEIIYQKIKRNLNRHDFTKYDKILIYSYWLHLPAFIAVNLKNRLLTDNKKVVVISRAHGFDIYENREKINYLPFRKYLLSNIYKIYSVSTNGAEFLKNKYPEWGNKINVSRLGTIDYGITPGRKTENVINIVSCSRAVALKRIDLIIKSLSKITNIKINWTHIGDGPELENLKLLAQENLPKNINYNWIGWLKNSEIMEFYKKNDFNIFINVSESEGLPVSIMEALSFGIPVIATNVGGTSEIVIENQNGFLLHPYFKPEELSNRIYQINEMDNSSYEQLQYKAREVWTSNFSAKKNYTDFIEEIKKIT